MNAFLAHLDVMPLFYGILMFMALAYSWHKLMTGQFVSVGIDMAVFWLVFSLHGGTMAGGFSAMIAAALSSIFFPIIMKRAWK